MQMKELQVRFFLVTNTHKYKFTHKKICPTAILDYNNITSNFRINRNKQNVNLK